MNATGCMAFDLEQIPLGILFAARQARRNFQHTFETGELKMESTDSVISQSFWQSVPPLDIVGYARHVRADSAVAESVVGRDCEIQALCKLVVLCSGGGPELMNEVGQSRVNTRRKFFGEWSDDGGPFSEAEVAHLRSIVKPWEFSDEFLSFLEDFFNE